MIFIRRKVTMADYNVQMQYFNGSSYDILYPKTIAKNIPISIESCPNIDNLEEYVSEYYTDVVFHLTWYGTGASTTELLSEYMGNDFIMIASRHKYEDDPIDPSIFIINYNGIKQNTSCAISENGGIKIFYNCITLRDHSSGTNGIIRITGDLGRYMNEASSADAYTYYDGFLFGK